MKKLKFNIADIVGGTATISQTLNHSLTAFLFLFEINFPNIKFVLF